MFLPVATTVWLAKRTAVCPRRSCGSGQVERYLAKASVKSVRGLITVEWEKGEGSFTMKVTVPVNATAEVHVPKLGLNDVAVSEGGKALWTSGAMAASIPGITDGSESDESIVLDVGSGSYEFKLTGQA